jgi:hypothetical protein
MKKNILALSLITIFAISSFAGNTPHTGYSGCPGGLWYPDEQICCMPGLECPVGGRSVNVPLDTKDTFVVELIAIIRNIRF